MEARVLRRLTVDEYLDLDRTSEERWEFVNGEAWAMSGASRRHNGAALREMLRAFAETYAMNGVPTLPSRTDEAFHES
jgi:hypothetical protein